MQDHAAWSLIFDRLPDGVCVTEASGAIIYMNSAAQKMLELPHNARGQILCDILCAKLSAPGRRDCASTCALRDPESTRVGVAYRGHYFGDSPVAKGLRVRCLRLGGEDDRRLVFLEEAWPANGANWEEPNPLAAQDLHPALSTVFSVLRDFSELPLGHSLQDGDKRMLGLGLGACTQALRMIELHKELARLEAELGILRREHVALDRLVRKAVDKAEPAALERQVGIGVEVPVGLYVVADAALLARVFDDLLLNGIRAAPSGGRLAIVATRLPGGKARLAFEDADPGLPPERLAEVFDRLHRARAMKEERRQGLGLRWLFCRRAVRAMGGRFELQSDPEAGSRVFIDLPLAQGAS